MRCVIDLLTEKKIVRTGENACETQFRLGLEACLAARTTFTVKMKP